jgi:hypothetical protein
MARGGIGTRSLNIDFQAALHPSVDDTGVLARRELRRLPETAREQIPAPAGVEGDQPLADRGAGLLGDLELHRPAGLFLDHRRAIANSPAGGHVIDPQPNEVAAPELAVDGQIEHRKIALAPLHLEANTDGPDIPWLQRALLADQAPLVPGVALP